MTESPTGPGGPPTGIAPAAGRGPHRVPLEARAEEADRGRGPRTRGGALLSALLPGAPQLAAGRWGTGGFALLTWLASWAVLLLRFERVVAAVVVGGTDDRVALVTLVLALFGSWAWSLWDLRRDPAAVRGGVSQWALATRAFRKNRLAVVGMMVIGLFYLVALLTPFVAPFDPFAQGDLRLERLVGPSLEHPLGTDHFARDVLSRVLYGARISLAIGFVAMAIAIGIGTFLGATSGFLGGKWDGAIMRFVDMVISFPRLVLLITIIALFEPSIFLIIAVLGLTNWPGTTRIVRGEVLSLREREFVQAAEALGYSRARIVLRHLIPNAMAPVIVAATLGIGNVIVLEAGLSFLGLGVQPPTPSWGTMVADGRNYLLGGWWISTFAGLSIVFTVLSFNLVGDGLRDALDPRLRS